MKTERERSMSCMKILLCLSAILMLLPTFALSEETYIFERMWPTLQQRWYFLRPQCVALDNNGYLYVSDTHKHRIQKFTIDGRFVLTTN